MCFLQERLPDSALVGEKLTALLRNFATKCLHGVYGQLTAGFLVMANIAFTSTCGMKLDSQKVIEWAEPGTKVAALILTILLSILKTHVIR